MSFSIVYDKQPIKFLKNQDKLIVKRIVGKIDSLIDNPVSHNVKPIVGKHNCFRLRTGDYRILYRINSNTNNLIVFKIDKRSKAYS
tara:strand:+ start:379 stop:636 length:258 start_codon:yes stop_codon:yes gene_type:complete